MAKLKPKLRFPEFNDEWILKKLSEISKIYDGTHQTPEYVDFGVPFYSVEHVTANQFENTKFISEDVFEKENKRVKLEKGDILMTRIGSIGVTKYVDWDVNASFYVSLALLKVKKNYNSEFVNHFISSPFFQSELWKRTIHVAFPQKINLGEIGDCMVILPSIDEQLKIGDFLSAVDEKINHLTKKKELLEKYKKGVMQKIFNQEIRFKDDNGKDFGDWEEKSFNSVLKSLSTKKHQIKTSDIFKEGKYPVIDQGKKRVAGFSDNLNNLYKDYPVIVFGDHTTILKYIDFDFIVGADGTKLFKNLNNDNLKYLYYNLIYNNVEQEGYKRHFSILSEISLQIPCLQEQTKIADFLSSIDEKINQVTIQLEKTKEFKKGLLQKMFV